MIRLRQYHIKRESGGFSLIELLVVIIMIGVLAALATPNWLRFVERQRLNTANNQIYQAVRQAQTKAKQEREVWQISFRETGSVVQWAIHKPSNTSPVWNNLHESLRIDTASTKLLPYGAFQGIRFNHKGCPMKSASSTCATNDISSDLPVKISLATDKGTDLRCVRISTLLGATDSRKDDQCSK